MNTLSTDAGWVTLAKRWHLPTFRFGREYDDQGTESLMKGGVVGLRTCVPSLFFHRHHHPQHLHYGGTKQQQQQQQQSKTSGQQQWPPIRTRFGMSQPTTTPTSTTRPCASVGSKLETKWLNNKKTTMVSRSSGKGQAAARVAG
jgi:hypothetical protein